MQARYALILEQTVTAQGDAAEQPPTIFLANQQKQHQAQMEDLQATIGEGLTPAMLQLTIAMNTIVGNENFLAFLASAAEGLSIWTYWR